MQRLQVPVLCSAGLQLDQKTQDIFYHFYQQITSESGVDKKLIILVYRPTILFGDTNNWAIRTSSMAKI